MTKNRIINIIKMVLGSLLYSAGICSFLNPADIAPGGASGTSIILNHLFGLPIGTMSILINVPILYFGYKKLDKKLIIKTVFALFFTSFLIDFVATPLFPVYSGDRLLASVFGGILFGTGLGIIFSSGFTTGGTDILSMLLRLKFPHVRIGIAILIIDFFVIAASIIFFGEIETGFYGIISLFFSGKVVDFFVYYGDSSRLAFIITDKSKDVSGAIIKGLGRGVTIINAQGAFTGNERKILLCAIRHREFAALKNIVFETDEKAFLTSAVSDGIFGEGFFRKQLF